MIADAALCNMIEDNAFPEFILKEKVYYCANTTNATTTVSAPTATATSAQHKLAYLTLDGPEYKSEFPDIIHEYYNVADIHNNTQQRDLDVFIQANTTREKTSSHHHDRAARPLPCVVWRVQDCLAVDDQNVFNGTVKNGFQKEAHQPRQCRRWYQVQHPDGPRRPRGGPTQRT